MPFGNPLVSNGGALVREAIKSPNYLAGVTGWQIRRDGFAEFANALIRGALEAGGAGGIIIGPGSLLPSPLNTYLTAGMVWSAPGGLAYLGSVATGPSTYRLELGDVTPGGVISPLAQYSADGSAAAVYTGSTTYTGSTVVFDAASIVRALCAITAPNLTGLAAPADPSHDVPVISGGGAFALGDATGNGETWARGNFRALRYALRWGAASVQGTGPFTFPNPIAGGAAVPCAPVMLGAELGPPMIVGRWRYLNAAGTSAARGDVVMSPGASVFALQLDDPLLATPVYVGAGVPEAWATGAQLAIEAEYPVIPPPPVPILRYRADDATGGAGADVTSLPSALPGGPALVSVTPTGTTGPPLLRLASLGTHKGLEFAASHPGGYMNGKGGRLFVPTSPRYTLTTHGGCTIFAVYRCNTGAGGCVDMAGQAPNIAARTGFFLANPPPADGSFLWRTYTPVTDNVAYVHEWRYSQSDLAYRRGGADQVLVINDDHPNPLTGRDANATYDTAYGGTFAFAFGNNLNGILYEVQVFDGVLAGDELTAARAYFASTYGLPA